MKSFKLYEDYLTQNEKQAQASAVYKEKVDQARAAVDSAKVKADEVVHAEIASGVDKATEKAAARKAIAKAEQDLVYALEEQTAANGFMNGKPTEIRDVDVVQAWLTDYRPAVQAEHLPSIKERIKLGQELLLSALYDHQSLKREYGGITDEVREMSDRAKQAGRQRDYYAIANPMNDTKEAGFSAENLSKMLNDVLRGESLPAGVTYHKEVK